MKQPFFRFNPGGQRWTVRLILGVAILIASGVSALAQSEEGIKAAFIYNFAKFTEWPDHTFASDGAPITVGFVRADSLADMLEKNVVGKNANGRDFAVKRFSSAAGTENCQIVFIGDAGQAAAVIGATKSKAVLTVGDSDGFADAGGMIRFIKDGAKLGFDLDLGASNASGLKLDPKLRQIARKSKGG